VESKAETIGGLTSETSRKPVGDRGEEIVRWGDLFDGETDGDRDATLPARWIPEAPPEPPTVREAVLSDVRTFFGDLPEDETFVPVPDDAFIEDRWFDFEYLEHYEEVERQWVSLPFAYVTVLYDEIEKEFSYRVVEVELDEFEAFVREDLTRILRNDLMYQPIAEASTKEDVFTERAQVAMLEHAATVEPGSLHKLLYYLLRDFIDLGEIEPMMRDADIEDVSCDGVDVPVFVYHRQYRDLRTNVGFGPERLNSFTVRLAQRAGKHISISDPLIDASLPDGSRIQLTLGSDVSTRGSNFTIRKFSDVPYTPVDLIEWNTFSIEQMAYFWLAIENNRSLIFAGGTGSGKTTSMNAVSFFIPPNSKVVSIEDTREITLPHDNWIQSVTRPPVTAEGRGEVSMYRLLQSALRQRPEYLLVGEIRTEQRVAFTFFQAIATGHTAYTTVHADSVEGAMSRLENEPLAVPAQMIQEVDVLSIQRQIFHDGERVRRNEVVAEVVPGRNPEDVTTRTVFERDARSDEYSRVNESHVLAEVRDQRGWTDEDVEDALAVREEVLEYLVDNGFRDYDAVTATIHTFAKDPEFVLEGIRNDTFDPDDLVARRGARSGPFDAPDPEETDEDESATDDTDRTETASGEADDTERADPTAAVDTESMATADGGDDEPDPPNPEPGDERPGTESGGPNGGDRTTDDDGAGR
jgi:flagellar protein FlaI